MRIFFLTLILVGGIFKNITGQIFYTKQDTADNHFYSVAESFNGSGFYIFNTNYNQPKSPSVSIKSQILLVSNNGDLINSIPVSTMFQTTSPILRYNKHFYLSGDELSGPSSLSFHSESKICKYDSLFNLKGFVVLDTVNNNYLVTSKLLRSNNRFYCAVNKTLQNLVKLYKLDLDLKKIDSTSFVGRLDDLVALNNGVIVLSGDGFTSSSVFGNKQVIKIDTSFNVINRFNFDNISVITSPCQQTVGLSHNTTLQSLGGDKYFITGAYPVVQPSVCIGKANQINCVVQSNTQIVNYSIKRNGSDNIFHFFVATSSAMNHSSIYNVSVINYDMSKAPTPPQKNNTRIMVQKTDLNNQELWTKIFGGEAYYVPYSIVATQDSGCIISGIRYDSVNFQVQDVCEGFIMKLDKDGRQVLTQLFEHGQPKADEATCYPNPAGEAIHFKLALQHTYEVTIRDVNGRTVKHENKYNNLSALPISDLPPGIYFYHITSGTKHYSGKFVKE